MNSGSGRILVVDDEEGVRRVLSRLLRGQGYEPLEAADGEQALALMRRESLDAILLDIKMPGLNGLEVLREVKALEPELPVIMITGDGLVQHAVAAIRMGAHDYLVKPFGNADVIQSLRAALTDCRHPKHVPGMARQTQLDASLRDTMGTSEAIVDLSAEVTRVACSGLTVLVVGETGTGKELVCRAIHAMSPRASAPFVAVDCGAIPETLFESALFGHEKGAFTGCDRMKPGWFEAAGVGTVFLDEVSNIPRSCQPKLLRVLQEKEVYRVGGTKPLSVGARVVAASNQNLEALVAEDVFRADLFYRLSDFVIQIPPLRERKKDIVFLAERFFQEASREFGNTGMRMSAGALQRLSDYNWPGNVRQLRSTVRRSALLAAGDGEICERHLSLPEVCRVSTESPGDVVAAAQIGFSLKEMTSQAVMTVERRALAETLMATGGNKAKAARILSIDYKTIHTKLKEYGLKTKAGGDR